VADFLCAFLLFSIICFSFSREPAPRCESSAARSRGCERPLQGSKQGVCPQIPTCTAAGRQRIARAQRCPPSCPGRTSAGHKSCQCTGAGHLCALDDSGTGISNPGTWRGGGRIKGLAPWRPTPQYFVLKNEPFADSEEVPGSALVRKLEQRPVSFGQDIRSRCGPGPREAVGDPQRLRAQQQGGGDSRRLAMVGRGRARGLALGRAPGL